MKSLTASYIASTSINGGNLQQRVHTLIPCSAIPRRGRHAVRHVTSASFHEAGYLLADAVSKVADKADQTAAKVGSVDAPGWVLPVAAISVAVVLSASSFLLKPGVEASENMRERDAKRWSKKK